MSIILILSLSCGSGVLGLSGHREREIKGSLFFLVLGRLGRRWRRGSWLKVGFLKNSDNLSDQVLHIVRHLCVRVCGCVCGERPPRRPYIRVLTPRSADAEVG